MTVRCTETGSVYIIKAPYGAPRSKDTKQFEKGHEGYVLKRNL